MKKLMMLLAFCGIASFAMAEETESYPTLKHQVVTNGFWDNWFIDLGVTHLSFYSDQERGRSQKKSPFWTGRRSWGGEIGVGKWITPVVGARFKAQAAWGTQVNRTTAPQLGCPTFHQVNFSLQPVLNLTNLIGGYKPRVWNISAYIGMGAFVAFDLTDRNGKDIDGANVSMMYTGGILNTFNITKRFHVNIDIYANFDEEGTDGITRKDYGLKKHRPRVFKTRDLQVGFSAGVGVNLGKVGWDNAPDMDAILSNHKAQLDALNASIAALEGENAALKNKLANQRTAAANTAGHETIKTITEFKATSASVFFNINKSVIASKKDLVNVKELAELAKSENKKIVVTGYADSKTGSSTYNQALSEKRAEAVKKALVDMGVSADNIETVGQGGVADLTPVSYNRRAVVTLK